MDILGYHPYTGIGSRDTPINIRGIMTQVAFKLARDGYILRSGCALGADTAFETGTPLTRNRKVTFLSWSPVGEFLFSSSL